MPLRLPSVLRILPVLLTLAVPAAAEPVPPMRIGVIGVQSSESLRAQWAPLAEDLSKALGSEVGIHISSDYAGVLWGLREGRDTIAYLGNKSAIEAVDRAGAEVFARWVYADGTAGYHSVLIVNAKGPLASTDAVFARAKELTLGLGDTNSTSGFLVPSYYLFARNGIAPRSTFRRVLQANHEENIRAVAEGRIDAATVADVFIPRVEKDHPGVAAAIRELWRSPEIPSDPLVWRRDLPDDIKARIRRFFLAYGQPARNKPAAEVARERKVLAGLGALRFTASEDGHLLTIRRVELYKQRLETEADEGLGADERQRRLEAIDSHLGGLQPAATGQAN